MEKKKQMKGNTPKKKQLVSDTEEIYNDLVKLISKYSGLEHNLNISNYSAPTSITEGFYLMFIKRNEIDPARRLQITEFSKNINIQDLTACFSDILENHMHGIKNTKNNETIN